jgi:hypothetical protein
MRVKLYFSYYCAQVLLTSDLWNRGGEMPLISSPRLKANLTANCNVCKYM